MVLVFRNGSSPILGSPAFPSTRPVRLPGRERSDRAALPTPTRPSPGPPTPASWPAVLGWRRLLPDAEGEKVTPRGPGPGGRGRAQRPCPPARVRRSPARRAAAGRGRLGHALFIAEPSARAAAAALAVSRAAGCARRGAGAGSLHNIVAAPRVMAQGRRGRSLAAGGGRCGWEGSGWGRFWVTSPKGLRQGGCVCACVRGLAQGIVFHIRLSIPPSSFKILKTWIPNTEKLRTVNGALFTYRQIYGYIKRKEPSKHHGHISEE